MKKNSFLILIVSVIMFYGCEPTKEKPGQSDFVNTINYGFTPEFAEQRGVPMSDLGAWHGIAMPAGDDRILGVTGPYLLGEFCWTGPAINAFMPEIDWNEAEYNDFTVAAHPGKFEVSAKASGLSIISSTVFASSRSYVTKVNISNTSDSNLEVSPLWQGKIFKPFQFGLEGNRIVVDTPKGLIAVSFDSAVEYEFSILHDTLYHASLHESLMLKPGEHKSFTTVVTYMPYGESISKEEASISYTLSNTERVFAENKQRWDGYIQSILREDLPGYDYVPVKSLQTLITNWKTPTGELKHQGLVPSMAVSYFYGFWAWDSWKHAVAVAAFDHQLAKDQIRTMFDYQDSMGMVADCVFPEPEDNNWRDTKPPLATWAVYEVYKATGDLDFVKELLPALEAYHQWWYNYRDFNQNGLCEWGSTDGTLIAAKWESGMDNAVRFDDAGKVKTTPYAYSLNQESVDLNAYLYYEKVLLAKLLQKVAQNEKANTYLQEAGELKDLINEVFYHEGEGFYFDVNAHTHEHILIAGPEGWTPLWCGVATDEIANNVARVMLDKNRFNTHVPLPTLDASHPKFAYDGYWRGSIWLDQVYFGIAALRKYGMSQEADELTMKVFHNLQGLDGDFAIYENYDAHTGEALRAPNFSWSAAHLLMMYQEWNK